MGVKNEIEICCGRGRAACPPRREGCGVGRGEGTSMNTQPHPAPVHQSDTDKIIELANKYAKLLGSPPNLWDCSQRLPVQVIHRWAALHRLRAHGWTHGVPYSYPQIATATTGSSHSTAVTCIHLFSVLLRHANQDTGLDCGLCGKSCGYGSDWPVCDRHRHVRNRYADKVVAKYSALWPESINTPHVTEHPIIAMHKKASS